MNSPARAANEATCEHSMQTSWGANQEIMPLMCDAAPQAIEQTNYQFDD
jgi:hypothetical protein